VHLLLFLILVCFIFPVLGRVGGSMISAICWLIVVVVAVLAMFGTFPS
jgi:hypothetical protein